MINKTYEEIIELEQKRQNQNVELIASENFPSKRVLNAAGSILNIQEDCIPAYNHLANPSLMIHTP